MLKTNTTDRIYRLQIFDNLIVDEKYGMPIVKKYNGEQPIKLQAFNKVVTQKQYENTVHFYLNDKEFLRILTYRRSILKF